MMIRTLILTSVAAFSLTACGGTFEGLKNDFQSFSHSVGSSVQSVTANNKADTKKAPVAMGDGTCPPIMVDPQLSSMSEFYDPANPKVGTEISTLDLVETRSQCVKDDEFLSMQIELHFAGGLGPKAKRKANDRPYFAYPYFVAVTDADNKELAKELFAASVTYESDQEKIELVETIRQKLPLNDNGSVPPYQIQIGFQLTEEQLFHNASN